MTIDQKTKERIAKACQTKTLQEVAVKFKCTRRTVVDACQVMGVEPVMSSKKRRAEVEAYIKSHPDVTVTEVANGTGASEFLAKASFVRLGLEPVMVTKQRRAEVEAYIKSHPDATATEVANGTGVSEFLAKASFVRLGLEPVMVAKRKRAEVAAYIKSHLDQSIEAVVAGTGCSTRLVKSVFASLGAKPARAVSRRSIKSLRIIAELQAWADHTALAAKYSVSRQRVQQLYRDAKDAGMVMP